MQTGFGRTGDHFWAFEGQGVIPDIGKSPDENVIDHCRLCMPLLLPYACVEVNFTHKLFALSNTLNIGENIILCIYEQLYGNVTC